jgi:hypothetical protein
MLTARSSPPAPASQADALCAPSTSGTTSAGAGTGGEELRTTYLRHRSPTERAITSFRFARAELARSADLARRRWFSEMGFVLARIGIVAAWDAEDAADRRAA